MRIHHFGTSCQLVGGQSFFKVRPLKIRSLCIWGRRLVRHPKVTSTSSASGCGFKYSSSRAAKKWNLLSRLLLTPSSESHQLQNNQLSVRSKPLFRSVTGRLRRKGLGQTARKNGDSLPCLPFYNFNKFYLPHTKTYHSRLVVFNREQ